MEKVLEVNGLVKNYNGFMAVNGISFSVPRGKVIGFLGPNGAGKTTTIQMLLGITEKTDGSIKYFGQDFFKNRRECLQRINFTSAFNTLLGRISVMENLSVYAGLYNVKNYRSKILALAEYFKATKLLNKIYWDLSAGQKTRVNLIKSLINDPELLLMDEPTASLDPDITDKTLTLIEELKRDRNLSILYTSHNMDEITRICDMVIFIDKGKIVAEDTPLNLTKNITGAGLRLVFDGKQESVKKYLSGQKQKFEFHENNTVYIDTTEDMIPKIIFGINKLKVNIIDIEVEKPNLEDVFLQIARKGDNVTS